MNCPICPDTQLLMTERRGVEIDYCPSCRGIWLDRGELDVLLERGETTTPAAVRDDDGRDSRPGEHDGGGGREDRDASRTRKRGGFLNDLLGGLGGD